MFTSEQREIIRSEIIEKAKSDARISGGAITGSATVGKLDKWSDIDLAFGVYGSSSLPEILKDYTANMYQSYGALHHLDVLSGAWVYRVFLLASTLQIDLAFAPEEQFGARASTFKLIFGKTGSASFDPPAQFEFLVGWCWLYALHVRSSIKRDRLWQAEYFISGMRDYVISLCCRRHSLPEKQGRGVDQLPLEERVRFEPTLIKSIQHQELQRAFTAVVAICLEEVENVEKNLCSRLQPALKKLLS